MSGWGSSRRSGKAVQQGPPMPVWSALSFLGLGILAAFVLSNSWLKWPDLLIDFGEELYLPWQLTEGRTLYDQLFYLRSPLSVILNYLAFSIFGVSFLTVVIVNLMVTAVLTVLIYRIFLHGGDRLTAKAACAVFLAVFACAQYVGVGNYNYLTPYSHEQTHGLLFGFAAIWLLCGYLDNRAPRRLFLIGVFLGLILLTKPDIFIAFGGGVVAALGLDAAFAGARAAALGRRLPTLLAGLALPSILLWLLFPLARPLGGLPGTLFQSWVHLPEVLAAVHRDPMSARLLGLDSPGESVARLVTQFLAVAAICALFLIVNHQLGGLSRSRIVPLVAGGMLVFVLVSWIHDPNWWLQRMGFLPLTVLTLLGLQVAAIVRDRDRPLELADRLPLLALTVSALLLLGRMALNTHLYHYGFSLAMPATLLLVHLLIHEGRRAAQRISGTAAVYLALVLVLGGVFSLQHLAMSHGFHRLKDQWVASTFKTYSDRVDPRGEVVNQVLDWLSRHLPPGSSFVALPEGIMLNFLSRHPNPTPYTTFNPILFGIRPEREILAALEMAPPDFVLLVERDNSEHGARYFGADYAYAVYRWVREEYEHRVTFGSPPFEGRGFGISILERRRRTANEETDDGVIKRTRATVDDTGRRRGPSTRPVHGIIGD